MPSALVALFIGLPFVLPAVAASAHGHAARIRREKRGLLATSSVELDQGQSLQALHPYYHTTEEISAELRRLAQKCPGMMLEVVKGNSTKERQAPDIDVVTVRAPGSRPRNKNFILFGEHSRELISPESGLYLVRALCGETDLSQRAKDVLRDSEFQLVVNANPDSRRVVEQGDFCVRTNPAGVDLNRNWDEEWQKVSVMDDTNPGPRPFSEPETQAFKRLVESYRPTTFLTVHSGTLGMYMPWAYDREHLANRNRPGMMSVLQTLDRSHCECPFGAAGKEVGYNCPGTCLDWVYDRLQTPFVFAFEIYVGGDEPSQLRERWREKLQGKGSLLQGESHLAHSHFKDLFEAHPSSFVQVKSEKQKGTRRGMDTASDCFATFNPGSAREYESVVRNWAAAYLDMAAMVADQMSRANTTNLVSAGSA